MSAKWVRARKWDDEHLTGALLPVKWVLRAFSSIGLAVVLLTTVSLYGLLASVPIGVLALAPTWIVYGSTVVAAIVAGAAIPAWLAGRALRSAGRGAQFAATLLAFIVLSVVCIVLWHRFAWPLMRYDAAAGTGFRFFASFIERTKSVQVRRLAGMEMSELEFYSWWPLRIVLLAFVLNMVVATVRRIEFSFPYIGVLTVHSGIVTIALGSIYYGRLKEEGDVPLMAGVVDESGNPTPGPLVTEFFDREKPALHLTMGSGAWEQRLLSGLPRYNDYGLDALNLGAANPGPKGLDEGRTLALPVPGSPGPQAGFGVIVDPRLKFEIVGYAQYATLQPEWVDLRSATGFAGEATGGSAVGAARLVRAFLDVPDQSGRVSSEPKAEYRLAADIPAERIAIEGADVTPGGLLAVEYTRGMPANRWADLAAELPAGAQHALIVEIPATGHRSVHAVEIGTRLTVGDTPGQRWVLEVKDLAPQPPMPIITRGFENATSSLAIVRVAPPQPLPPATGPKSPEAGGIDPAPPEPKVAFERWVYHRFPEINQDLSDETNERGMPKRGPPDPAIRIAYIDASVVQVYIDERPADGGGVRTLTRLPKEPRPTIAENLKEGSAFTIAQGLRMEVGPRLARVELPRHVPSIEQDKRFIGTHRQAAIAVRASWAPGPSDDPEFDPALSGWSRTVWLPYADYFLTASDDHRSVRLPDGRRLSLAFGQLRRPLRGVALQLADFEMYPYPHSDVPRDWRSDLMVHALTPDETTAAMKREFKGVRSTSMNNPLLVRVGFQRNPDAPGWANAVMRAISVVAPLQYKFSQAGWDAEGWQRTQQMVSAGQAKRPTVRYTVLGVGTNPGIYIIAVGAVMMAVGIPWAFYVKPMIMRRRKRLIQEQLAREGKLPARAAHRKREQPETESAEVVHG